METLGVEGRRSGSLAVGIVSECHVVSADESGRLFDLTDVMGLRRAGGNADRWRF